MRISEMVELYAGLEQVEMEGTGAYIQQVGTQFCVRSRNIQDKNFGCYPSKEEALKHLHTLESASQYGQPGWQYGRSIARDIGYIPRRSTAGFPLTRSRGARPHTLKTPSHKPNQSVGHGTAFGVKRPNISIPRPRIEGSDWGEPMTGNMGHAHIDPVVWFRPPSLTAREKDNKARIPTDDPREDNDRFLDVTKRNSKDTKEQRMKILKRGGPAGLPPQIPVRTTLINPHTAVYMPSSMFAAHRRKSGLWRQGRMFVGYGRQGVL